MYFPLEDNLHNTCQAAIARFNLHGSEVTFVGWSPKETKLLQLYLEYDADGMTKFRDMIKKRIFAIGREMIRISRDKGQDASLVPSREALAFTLQYDSTLTEKEIDSIVFAPEFPLQWYEELPVNTLIETVLNQLLGKVTTKSPIYTEHDGDTGGDCCHF